MIASLANHLWQSTLFALAVVLLIRSLRNDAARIRYALWLAASVKFLVPFSLLAALGSKLAGSPEAPIAVIAAWSPSLERLVEPVTGDTFAGPLGIVLIAVWIAGTATVFLRAVLQARTLEALVRSASDASALAGVPAGLPVRRSTTRIEPALVGILRPVLLIPEDVEARLTEAQLQAVIAHELCHWKRRDNLTGALHMLVEALFWFHPLVWWIGARLMHERERACDEAVVEAGHDRRAYAEAILNVAELRIASPMKCAAGVGGVDLKGRVTAVMRSSVMKKLGMHKKMLLSLGATSAIVVPVVFGWLAASSSARAQAQELVPVMRVAPVYPPEALAVGLEGYVIVEFTIDEDGSIEDAFVVESSSPVFEEAALDATRKFKYEPTVIDGRPIAVPRVRNKIAFVMDDDDLVHDGSLQDHAAVGNAA